MMRILRLCTIAALLLAAAAADGVIIASANGITRTVTLHVTPPPPPAPAPTPPPAAGPPAAPTALSAQGLAATRVQLFWRDNSDNERAFAIWRKTNSTDWARVGVVPPSTTTFTDASVMPGTAYTYRVRATNQYASAWSNEVTVLTPGGV